MAMLSRHLLVLALAVSALSCSSSSSSPGIPDDVKAILFLQRAARNDGVGNVFDYTSFAPGARLAKLEPPAVDGKVTTLTHDPLFSGCDIMAYDLSFDARTIVLSARLKDEEHYHLFVMNVDGSNPRQITAGPYHYVYPIFLPGQRIMFMASKSVEPEAKQFQDEYERQTTAQVGVMNVDGSGEVLGPRNVSHRVAPALLPDGNVIYTEWRHLGEVNDGHLRLMNADMTGMREAFGGESRGVTNSYLKARPVETIGKVADRSMFRIVTVATDRERTLQSGKLLLVDLNESEKRASVVDMTPQVPGGNQPSTDGIGRYYDAEPIGPPADRRFLVSWADGPVESELLQMAGTPADFGLYVFAFDGREGKRHPLYDQKGTWEVMARPLRVRESPPPLPPPATGGQEKSFVVGALNVYESSVFPDLQPGQVHRARLLEGFSAEEGFPDMFGLTEFDGQSRYGEIPVYPDGSFAAKVPANVPLHIQLLDRFAMAVASEDIWVSGRPGEQRFCGGCHEDRSRATPLEPGSRQAVLQGPVDLDVPRAARQSLDYSYEKVRGVPWNLALQPIFDRKCIKCHDGAVKPGNRSFTLVDATAGTSQTFTFNLRGDPMPVMVGERRDYDYPASYISLLGLQMELGRNMVTVQGGGEIPPAFVVPGQARGSAVIRKLNPPQRFPTVDMTARAFPGPSHPAELGEPELTADELYLLILNIDMGAQYMFRENRTDNTPKPSPVVMP